MKPPVDFQRGIPHVEENTFGVCLILFNHYYLIIFSLLLVIEECNNYSCV